MTETRMFGDQRDHGVHHAVRGTTLAKLQRAHAQDIAHMQGRVFLEVLLQKPVGPFHTAQGFRGQTLGAGAVFWRELGQDATRQGFGHQARLVFVQHCVEQLHRAASGLHSGI